MNVRLIPDIAIGPLCRYSGFDCYLAQFLTEYDGHSKFPNRFSMNGPSFHPKCGYTPEDPKHFMFNVPNFAERGNWKIPRKSAYVWPVKCSVIMTGKGINIINWNQHMINWIPNLTVDFQYFSKELEFYSSFATRSKLISTALLTWNLCTS